MIAVKYRQDALEYAVPFNYPEKIKKPVTVLPSGYDVVLTDAEYTQLLIDNQSAMDTLKTEQATLLANSLGASRFKAVRDKWQDIADVFANSNVGLGITTAEAKIIADGFSQVKYYLDLNVPMQALLEIDSVPVDSVFLTLAKRNELKVELALFITSTFGI